MNIVSRADNQAPPHMIGGQNEVVEVETSHYYVGEYNRGAHRQLQIRFVLWQWNSHEVIVVPAQQIALARLLNVLHSWVRPHSRVVVHDYPTYGGIGTVRTSYGNAHPQSPVCDVI